VRCSILIERREGPGQPKTLRRKAGQAAGAREPAEELARERFDWDWEKLLDSTPELAGEIQLETVSLPTEDGWTPRTRILNADYPFVFRTDCPAWAAELIPRAEVLEELTRVSALPLRYPQINERTMVERRRAALRPPWTKG